MSALKMGLASAQAWDSVWVDKRGLEKGPVKAKVKASATARVLAKKSASAWVKGKEPEMASVSALEMGLASAQA